MSSRYNARFLIALLMIFIWAGPVNANLYDPFHSGVFQPDSNFFSNLTIDRVDSYPGQPGYPTPPGPPVGGNNPSYPPSYPGYESADQLYQNGMAAFSRSDFRSAISYFTRMLDRYPYDRRAGDACYYCADSYKQLNDFYNAITLFRRVVNQYPQFSKVDEAAYFIGFCLVKANDFYGAIQEFRSFISRYTFSHLVDNAWYVMGRTHEQVNDLQNAIFSYRKVVYDFPNSDVYYAARERLNILEGNYPPPYPPYPPIQLSDRELYSRGHSELVQGNFSNAITYFDELLKRYPRSELADDAALWKGKTYLEEHSYSNAMNSFAWFKANFKNSDLLPEACYSLGWSKYKIALGSFSQREYFRKAAADFIDFSSRYGSHFWAPEALFLAGDCYERYGDINTARSYYREVVLRYPNTPSAQKAHEKLNGMY